MCSGWVGDVYLPGGPVDELWVEDRDKKDRLEETVGEESKQA